MSVDPQRQVGSAVERLTTGADFDVQPALSPDGRKLAFTAQNQSVRAWLFPFDSARGRITGSGRPVTSSGLQAWTPNLSQDGRKLVFFSDRHGKLELRQALMSEMREIPIAVTEDSYMRVSPQWSRDSRFLAYSRRKAFPAYAEGRAEIELENELMLWSSQDGAEEPLTGSSQEYRIPYDWSPDDKMLLISQLSSQTGHYEVWKLPLAARPHAEDAAQKIISDQAYDIFQGHFSPDGRWIVFEAIGDGPSPRSTLYTMPAGGGSWNRITDGKSWDDKPRWSPDGKMIYFVSGHNGFFNVWGIRFDPATGKAIGDEFQVTAFERPALMIPQRMPWVEISVTQNRLALNLAQVSGNIWMLDRVDQ